MFFQRGSTYEFDPNELAKAHNACQELSARIMQDGSDLVVSNTFTAF